MNHREFVLGVVRSMKSLQELRDLKHRMQEDARRYPDEWDDDMKQAVSRAWKQRQKEIKGER